MRSSKFNSQRPGSSARVYDYEKTEYERTSRIPKIPRRTHSLERKGSSYNNSRTSKMLNSTTSMIPRPEWKKYCNKPCTPESPKIKFKQDESKCQREEIPRIEINPAEGIEIIKCSPQETSDDTQTSDDFVRFKNNVLRIPEYWTDAGQTVTNILKNAINIVTKQYPSADVETFETEIQNILKATEAVKQQILLKTEGIINQANKLYIERSGGQDSPSEEELLKITRKMEHLRNEVHLRKNVFGDLLKCSSEMKQIMELEKALKHKTPNNPKCNVRDNQQDQDRKKSKIESGLTKKKPKTVPHSCGDVFKSTLQAERPLVEDKSSQTTYPWTVDVERKQDLSVLNNQILELHQLCKDHISKFKSFNLQIKLRGICNKAQNLSVSKEIQVLNDEKLQLREKNNKLYIYNKDLESVLKQKDLELHQKDRLISQQKKLLHVRDELIEMLKSRCNIDDVQQL